MTSETVSPIEMRIHEILALIPSDARKLFESLRAERKGGNTTNTLEGLLKQYDGNLHAIYQALDTHVPVILASAEWETDSASNRIKLSTQVNITMPLSSKIMLPFEQVTSSETGKTGTVDVATIKKIAELLLDKAVLNRNELADVRGCLAVWTNIIGKVVASYVLPNQSWDLEKGKRMSEDELAVCQKVFALISYLCDNTNTP